MMKSNYYEEDNAEGEDNDGDDGQTMKRMSLERNDYEEEADVGQGDDRECQEDEDNDVNEGDEDDEG